MKGGNQKDKLRISKRRSTSRKKISKRNWWIFRAQFSKVKKRRLRKLKKKMKIYLQNFSSPNNWLNLRMLNWSRSKDLKNKQSSSNNNFKLKVSWMNRQNWNLKNKWRLMNISKLNWQMTRISTKTFWPSARVKKKKLLNLRINYKLNPWANHRYQET